MSLLAASFLFLISVHASDCDIGSDKNYKTETIKFRESKLVADFVVPTDCKTQPKKIIVHLGGSEGGISTHLAEQFATKGFGVVSLGYFGVDGSTLPKTLTQIPLEYFLSAINEIKRLYPQAECCSLIGGSKGAEAILTLAAYTQRNFNGLVMISGSNRVFEGLGNDNRPSRSSSWTYKGKDISYTPIKNPSLWALLKMAISGFKEPPELKPIYMASIKDKETGNSGLIPIENIKSDILFLSGAEDNIWPASLMVDEAHEAAIKKGFKYKIQKYVFPRVGHAVIGGEHALKNPKLKRILGGDYEASQKATPKAYELIMNFLLQQKSSAL